MSLRSRLLAGTLTLVLAGGLLWMTGHCLLRGMVRWLDVGQRPRQSEYLMLLNGDNETRPFAAAALVKAGFARHVLLTKVAPSPYAVELGMLSAPEVAQRVLLERGVPTAAVTILPVVASTTYNEAEALAAFLKDRPKTRVLVVTSDYHTRRSRWAFARALGEQADQLSFFSAPTDALQTDHWWRDEAAFVAITSEYLKLAFYVVRYGYLGYWLPACGGLVLVAAWIRRRHPDVAATT